MNSIKQDFKPITWMLIPIAIIVNGAGGWIIAKLNVPLYFDSIGTIFTAIVAGPWAGALTGVATNIIISFISPGYAPYWPVPLFIGLIVGFLAIAGWFKHLWKVVAAGIIVAIVAATVSSFIAANVYGGFTFDLLYFIFEEPLDKIISALIATIIAQSLPKSIFSNLPRLENVKSDWKEPYQ